MLALMIDGVPQVAHLPTDLHMYLVKMPSPMAISQDARDTLVPDISGEERTETVHHSRSVSWKISITRWKSRSSKFRKDSGNHTYILTTSRITSDDGLK
ncbi:hypothetical protein BH11PSE5_BH11PSE5_06570 [soil metagenome]